MEIKSIIKAVKITVERLKKRFKQAEERIVNRIGQLKSLSLKYKKQK